RRHTRSDRDWSSDVCSSDLKQFDEDEAAELERKIRSNEFTLDDFLKQLRQIRKMGPLTNLLGMLPGMGAQLKGLKVDERELDRRSEERRVGKECGSRWSPGR